MKEGLPMRLMRRHGPGQARAAQRPAVTPAAPRLLVPERSAPAWRAGDARDRADDDDVISLGGLFGRDYDLTCGAAVERLIAMWQATTGTRTARARSYAIGGALCGVVVVILAMLGTFRPGGPAGTGTAGCAALSELRLASAPGYQRIRAQFAGGQWPDLRHVGMPYLDLAVAPPTVRIAGRYEPVWFDQRRGRGCARHGAKMAFAGPAGARRRARKSRPACLTWRPAGGARLAGEICGYARAAPG